MNPSATLLAALLGQQKQQSSLLSLLPLLLIGAVFIYLFTVQPKKQRQKHADFVSSLAPGTEVVTSGGIHGTINAIEDDIVHLQVDTDVVIRVSKASLARREADAAEPRDRRGAEPADE